MEADPRSSQSGTASSAVMVIIPEHPLAVCGHEALCGLKTLGGTRSVNNSSFFVLVGLQF